MDGRGRAREIVDLVDLDIERKGHVVPHQLETLVIEKMLDIVPAAGVKIVDTQNICPPREPLAKMRAEKTRAPGDQNPSL